ncbi:MAG: ATP-binding protein [Halopseudomonas sp.]
MTRHNLHSRTPSPPSQALDGLSSADAATEAAWVDVVHQMEEVYSDLIKYQVEIEQKNQELEQAQQFIASVLTSMTDILIVCDQHGQIQQVNRSLEQLTGKPESRLIGQSMVELFNSASQQLIHQQQIRTPFAFEDCEVMLLSSQGEMPLAMNGSARRDSRGRLLGGVLMGRPIGELRRAYDELNRSHRQLKQAQQQLIDSEKMASLGRLVAGVAHELNNPISFVYGNVHSLIGYADRLNQYLQLLHRQQPSAEVSALRQQLRIDKLLIDLPSLLDGTMEGAERVRDIVMDLRQFSSGQQQHNTEFDLVHTIQTAVHWVTRDAAIKLRIGYDLPKQLLIQGHPGQIQQVLINMVQNAIDAMAEVEKPRLNLRLKTEANRVVFTIRDNGPGIAEQHLTQLFEPFFTTKPVGQGTGLGLSLSYGLVGEHGGRLQASNHVDGGAMFRVELPLFAVEDQRSDAAPITSPVNSGGQL